MGNTNAASSAAAATSKNDAADGFEEEEEEEKGKGVDRRKVIERRRRRVSSEFGVGTLDLASFETNLVVSRAVFDGGSAAEAERALELSLEVDAEPAAATMIESVFKDSEAGME